MASYIGRRKLLATLGSAAAAWPLVAHAQQSGPMRRVVFLHGLAANDPEAQARAAAFREGLDAFGWREKHNIQIEHLFSSGDISQVQAHVAEVVSSIPDVIAANSTPVIAALKRATHTIPIVFSMVNDPAGQGFVSSLAHPGGNITGFSFINFTLIGKWLEILKEIAPGVRRMAFMFNPEMAPYYPVFLRDFGAATTSLAAELLTTPVHTESEIEAGIAALAQQSDGGLIAAPDPFINTHRALIVRLAARHRLPAIVGFRRFVGEGALISYGPDTADIVRRSASYVDRVLKGEKPADLPVQAPTKYELAINLKTAKALGLDLPPKLLALADEVIE
jgi:putative ABC transport system substrate-binding protein